MLLYFTRILLTCLCFGSITLNLLAQDIEIASKNTTDSIAVVYLQDGSKFHGFLDAQTDSTTSLSVVGGSRLVFANSTIDSIGWIMPTPLSEDKKNKLRPVKIQLSTGRFLFGDQNRYNGPPVFGELTTLFRLQKGKPHYLGIGTGINYFSDQDVLFIPVYLSFQTELLPEKDHTPFYYADFGYGFNQKEDFQNNWRDIEELNGIRYGLGVGLKNKKRPTTWSMAIGYHYQRYNFNEIEQWRDPEEQLNQNIHHLRRLKLQFIIEDPVPQKPQTILYYLGYGNRLPLPPLPF